MRLSMDRTLVSKFTCAVPAHFSCKHPMVGRTAAACERRGNRERRLLTEIGSAS